MASQKFENVWDALEDTPADAASMTLRSSLLIAIDLRVRGWKITQVEAARRLGLTQPRLNDLLRGKINKFSLDALTDIAAKADVDAVSMSAELSKPRAESVSYDRSSGRVVVHLTNRCRFEFPARLVQGLEHASDKEVAAVRTIGCGSGLHWEKMDVDLSIAGLLSGIFGTKKYMAGLARGQTSRPSI